MPLSHRGRMMGGGELSGGGGPLGYSKYKFKVLAVQGGPSHTNVAFAEIELRETIGGADVTGSGTATASGDIGASYAAPYAVDNNATTMWNCGTGGFTDLWWAYDFGINKIILEYTIQTRASYLDDSPTSWEIYGWNGTAYELIKSQTTPATWTASEIRTFTI